MQEIGERNSLGKFIAGHKFIGGSNKGKHWKVKDTSKMSEARKREWDNNKRSKTKLYFQSGPNHPNWKGGIAKDKRIGNKYLQWRSDVFTRDNWTCQTCGIRGSQTGGYLQAHHIKSWAKFPELRYKLDNGVTLCKECHKLTDNYTGKLNKKI